MRIIKNCIVCGNEFYFRNAPSDRQKEGGKYCNKACQNKNMSKVLKEKGIKPMVHGISFGTLNPAWRGDKVSYDGLHRYIKRHLGTPRECEHCGTTTAKRYEWANKSGLYLRDFTDWIRLCTSCHRKYDNSSQKAWQTRRANLL